MKISVITATYNSAETLSDTLESILMQTHQDYEVIIQDGLSTDGTIDLVHQFEPRFGGRLKIFSEKDKGLYDAMNKGIAHATGEVIGILNSDDFYHDKRVLEDISRTMEEKQVECVYGNLKFVKHQETDRVVRIWKGSQHESGDFLKGWHPAHPTFYARKECYDRLGTFDLSFPVSADFELMLRFLEKAGISNCYMNRYFVNMRMGGESTASLRNIIKGNRGVLRALRKNGFTPSRWYIFYRMLPKIWARFKGIFKK